MRNIQYNEVAVVVCTFKNRFDILLKHLSSYKPFQVYVVCKEWDYTESGYDKYDWDDNVHVLFEQNVHNIMESREWARKEIRKLGYRAIIILDDDMKGDKVEHIVPEKKRATSDTYGYIYEPFVELLKELVNRTNEYDASWGSPIFFSNIGFYHPGKTFVNTTLNYGQFCFVNLEDMEKLNMCYDVRDTIHEDADLVFQFLRNGCTCITLGDWAYVMSLDKASSKVSTVGDENYENFLKVGLYLKWKDYVTLTASYRGEVNKNKIGIRSNTKRLFNNKEEYVLNNEYCKGLYELCEQEMNGGRDSKKIVEYIRNNKHLKTKKIKNGKN